jgi:two-component system, NarL family, sensor histidine kinase UhpB
MIESNMLETIVDMMPTPAFVIDNSHRVILWNTALSAVSGIGKEKMVGTDQQWRAFYREKRPTMADLLLDKAPTSVLKHYYSSTRSRGVQGVYQAEDFFPAMGRNGKWFFMRANAIRQNNKEITAVIETLEDVTKRKLAEKKLRQSEHNYKTLFESTSDAIIVHDLKGKIRFANPAAFTLTGYSIKELIGKKYDTLWGNGDFRFLNRVKNQGRYESKLKKKNGHFAICMVTSDVITDEGKPRFVQNMLRDITAERRTQDNLRYYMKKITQAQEEERKSIARELHDDTLQVLISLSRELNNIVSEERNIDANDRQLFNRLKAELDRSKDNVQRFSQTLRFSVLDDLGLVPALRSLLKNLQNDGIVVEIRVNGEIKRLSNEKETLLFRIVQEASNNIRKHARAKHVLIEISFNNSIRLVIEDDGCGFNVPASLGELPRDNKLGLVGIEERVRLLDGTLDIHSEPGHGTKIAVETSSLN